MPPGDETLYTDRIRAASFGDDPLQYDRARPSYPEELIDFLVEENPLSVVDVGCGTGIASRQLRARGCSVLGVEPDERMAEVARRGGIEVEVGAFEVWSPGGRRFDLLISAQAWHWIDPTIGAARAAEALGDRATFACFWNVGRPSGPVQAAFDACYEEHAPGVEEYSVLLGHGSTRRFELVAEAFGRDGHFGDIATTSFPQLVTYSGAEWLDHLATHSDHRNLPPAEKEALFSAIGEEIVSFGGAFELLYENVCVSGRRLKG